MEWVGKDLRFSFVSGLYCIPVTVNARNLSLDQLYPPSMLTTREVRIKKLYLTTLPSPVLFFVPLCIANASIFLQEPTFLSILKLLLTLQQPATTFLLHSKLGFISEVRRETKASMKSSVAATAVLKRSSGVIESLTTLNV